MEGIGLLATLLMIFLEVTREHQDEEFSLPTRGSCGSRKQSGGSPPPHS